GGSTAPARQGKLHGLMGAQPADATRARPVLDQLCRKVEHCGAVGAGSSMKLAINLPLMIGWQAYAEAFSLVRDLGWEPKRLVELFTESNGANNGFKLRADMIIAMLGDRDPGPTTFSVANAVKDLKTMIATGTAKGADMPAAKAALAAIEKSNNDGLGASDASRQTVYWSGHGKK
ncbi:MAG TPA: NAD-binding protein, partial [Xanthobacteraceae bacterium]|nr:NAD-binding protein [Xanthobacteraceae bacterium]